MDVLVSFEDPRQAWTFIESLRSRKDVSRVSIVTDVPRQEPETVSPEANEPSFYDRHHGSIPNLDVADFEAYLEESRRGWDEREAAHDRIWANSNDNPYLP